MRNHHKYYASKKHQNAKDTNHIGYKWLACFWLPSVETFVTKEVEAGRNYLIFPEGTRSRNGNEMLEFHGGSFRCATKSKCPIVPIALVDSFKVLDEKGSKPVSMQLHYLKPIPYEEYQGMKPAEVAELVKERIAEKIRESL